MTARNGKPTGNLGHRNLKKGKVDQSTLRAAEAMEKRPEKYVPEGGNLNPTGNRAAIVRARERDEEIRQLGVHDPEKVQEELYGEMSVQTLRLTRKLNRSGGLPDRLLIEAWKELRQAGLVVLEIRRSRGSLAEAEDFFAEIGTRMLAATDSGALDGVFPVTQPEPVE